MELLVCVGRLLLNKSLTESMACVQWGGKGANSPIFD